MRALVVQTAHLGDLVLTVPLLRALHGVDGGGGRLTLVTTSSGAELLQGQRWVDDIVVYRKAGGGGSGMLALMLRLAREPFDVAIAAQRSFRTGCFVRASHARARIGFARAPGAWAYRRKVRWDPDVHAVDRYLALGAAIPGLDPSSCSPQIDILPDARRQALELLRKHGVGAAATPVALAPGSLWGTKRWTPEGFVDVARSLSQRGQPVVVVGAASERELCREIAEAAEVPSLAGETTLPVLAALLAEMRALVANDSGSGHLAAAVGTSVVTIFGPTAPGFGYAPYGAGHRTVEHRSLDCRPCHPHGPHRCPLGHFRCMRDLPSNAVLETVEAVLRLPGSRA